MKAPKAPDAANGPSKFESDLRMWKRKLETFVEKYSIDTLRKIIAPTGDHPVSIHVSNILDS